MPSAFSSRKPRQVDLGVLHDRALGQLDHQAAGLEAGDRERVAHVLDQVALLQMAAGDVDRHAQPVAGGDRVTQRTDLRARVDQHPATELDDPAGFLGDRDERAGHHDAALRVIPAHQRLDAQQLAAASGRRPAGTRGRTRRVPARGRCPAPAAAGRAAAPACAAGTPPGAPCRRSWRCTWRCRRCAAAARRRRRAASRPRRCWRTSRSPGRRPAAAG